MATSTHKYYISESSTSDGIADNDGGVIMNGGNIGSSRHTNKSILDTIKGAKDYGSMVKANTGTANEIGITTARSGGTLAYNPNGRAVTRSSTDTGFLIRGGSPTLISGVSGTGGILSIPGSDTTARRAGNLHFTERVYQKGTWATTIFDLFGGGFGLEEISDEMSVPLISFAPIDARGRFKNNQASSYFRNRPEALQTINNFVAVGETSEILEGNDN